VFSVATIIVIITIIIVVVVVTTYMSIKNTACRMVSLCHLNVAIMEDLAVSVVYCLYQVKTTQVSYHAEVHPYLGHQMIQVRY